MLAALTATAASHDDGGLALGNLRRRLGNGGAGHNHNNHGGGGGGGGGASRRGSYSYSYAALAAAAARLPQSHGGGGGGASGGAPSVQDLFSKLFGAGGSHPSLGDGPGGKSYSYSYDSYYSYSYDMALDDGWQDLFKCSLADGSDGFECDDQTCIPGGHQCDAKHQCPDGSDELGCDFECIISAGVDGYRCSDGSCVAGERLCDGESNCADGSDELGCSFECVLPHGGQGHMCSDGRCIHSSYACDGEANCADGSDEMGCGFQCTATNGMQGWLCRDGTCVAGKHVCDGSSNCAEGAAARPVLERRDALVAVVVPPLHHSRLLANQIRAGRHVADADAEASLPEPPRRELGDPVHGARRRLRAVLAVQHVEQPGLVPAPERGLAELPAQELGVLHAHVPVRGAHVR